MRKHHQDYRLERSPRFIAVLCSSIRDKTSEFIEHQDVKGSSRCQVNLACDDEG